MRKSEISSVGLNFVSQVKWVKKVNNVIFSFPYRVLTALGVQCCYGVDIDAVCGWLGSYGGEDSVSDISRGKFFTWDFWCSDN